MGFRTLKLFVVLICGAILTGCSHQYYASNMQQVPLFTEKNQWQVEGAASFGDQVSATDIGLAYSATSHIAVMAEVNWMRGEITTNNSYMRSGYAEGAVGYFTKLDKYGVFEIYGGVGRNGQHHQYDSTGQTADLAYTKLFVQPVIGFKKGHIEAGLSCRLSQINFTQVDTHLYESTDLPAKTSYTLIEPAFTFRVGGDNVKFQFQRQLSSQMSLTKTTWAYTPSMWSFGIQFAFGGTPKEEVSNSSGY